MKKNLLYLFFGLIVLSSCETDIDTLAKYKDITVVYGLLNPNDTTHYIKITKAFSGEGNANDLANNGNNYYYADGEISVIVDGYDASDVFKKSYSLTRAINEIPKENGVFDETQNVLYKFTEPSLKRDYTYKLKIFNNKLDKEITSETKLVSDPVHSYFTEMETIKLFNSSTSLTHSFSIKPKENSGRVKVYFVFNYTEHYTDSTNKNKSIKISLGEQKTTSTFDGGEILQFSLEGSSLLSAIQNNIPATVPNLRSRSISNGTLQVIVAGTDLSTYIAVNEPSSSINQNKPDFTNITNGLGVYSSRNTKTIYAKSFFDELDDIPANPENYYGFKKDGRVNYSDDTVNKLINMGWEFCYPFAHTSTTSLPLGASCESTLGASYWSTINP